SKYRGAGASFAPMPNDERPGRTTRGAFNDHGARLCAAIDAGLVLWVVRLLEWDRKIHIRAVIVAGRGAERIVGARREDGLRVASVLLDETPKIAQPVRREIEVVRTLPEQQILSADVIRW